MKAKVFLLVEGKIQKTNIGKIKGFKIKRKDSSFIIHDIPGFLVVKIAS